MSQPTDDAERPFVSRLCQSSFCRLLGGAAWEARIHDISPLGLALRARVVYARALPDGRWLVGCAFDAPLPDALVELIQ